MANIAKITLPSGDEYDIKDSFVRNKTIEYIVGTQTAATNLWTGVTTDSALYTGKVIAYKLPYAGTSSAASLNLTLSDGTKTGAISVKMNNNSNVTTHFSALAMVYMTYDGTVWRTQGEYWSYSNTVPSAYSETAAGTAAKTASCSNYALTPNTYLHFDIRYANTSASALTMAVNGTAGKPIYINGTASSASNYTLPAGTYIAFYDGTNWYFRTDGILPTGGVNVSNKANMIYNATTQSLDFIFS